MHKKIYLSVILGICSLSRVKTKNNITKKVVPCFIPYIRSNMEAPHILTDKIDAELQKVQPVLESLQPKFDHRKSE